MNRVNDSSRVRLYLYLVKAVGDGWAAAEIARHALYKEWWLYSSAICHDRFTSVHKRKWTISPMVSWNNVHNKALKWRRHYTYQGNKSKRLKAKFTRKRKKDMRAVHSSYKARWCDIKKYCLYYRTPCIYWPKCCHNIVWAVSCILRIMLKVVLLSNTCRFLRTCIYCASCGLGISTLRRQGRCWFTPLHGENYTI